MSSFSTEFIDRCIIEDMKWISLQLSTDKVKYCECGCGTPLKPVDKYGKPRRFINGHVWKNRTFSVKHKRNLSKSHTGRTFSEETRRKISKSKMGNQNMLGYKHTKETRRKMSESQTGLKHGPTSEETRRKISKANKGKKCSEEHKSKLSESLTGRTFSEETRRKMSEAKQNMSEETKRKMSEAAMGRTPSEETRRKMSEARKGKKHTKESRHKMSIAQMGNQNMLGYKHTKETRRKMSEGVSGENHPNWQGGISHKQPYCYKFTEELKEHIRDKYFRLCLICGKDEEENGRLLDVHHVDYNKDQGCDEHEWHLVPLCISCHSKTGNISKRKYYEKLIRSLIEQVGF